MGRSPWGGFAVYTTNRGLPSTRPIRDSTYLGTTPIFGTAVADFAAAYVDQNEVDHRALVGAINDGRVVARSDV